MEDRRGILCSPSSKKEPSSSTLKHGRQGKVNVVSPLDLVDLFPLCKVCAEVKNES